MSMGAILAFQMIFGRDERGIHGLYAGANEVTCRSKLVPHAVAWDYASQEVPPLGSQHTRGNVTFTTEACHSCCNFTFKASQDLESRIYILAEAQNKLHARHQNALDRLSFPYEFAGACVLVVTANFGGSFKSTTNSFSSPLPKMSKICVLPRSIFMTVLVPA